MTIRAVALLTLCALCSDPSALGAQAEVPTSFTVRRGDQVIATERYTRTATALTGELRIQGGPTLAYDWSIESGGRVSRGTVRVTPPAAGGATPAPQVVELQFQGDTVQLGVFGSPGARVPATAGSIPFLNLSAAVLEQVVLRARRAAGDSVRVPLLDPLSGRALGARVLRAATSEATLEVGPVSVQLALDPTGRLLGGWVPSQGVVFERTAPTGGRLPAGATEPVATAPEADYSAPSGAPYTAEKVRVLVAEGFALGGTLTMPRGRRGSVPVVVLAFGSGPQDRDGAMPAIAGYRIFRQLADTLGRRGVGVLRVDDRGVGASQAGPAGATTADLANDLRAAVAWLRSRPEVDGGRIAVAGHSEGALTAAMLAAEDPRLRAIVLMAGPARPGREISLEQNRRMLESTPGLSPAGRDSLLAEVPGRLDALAVTGEPWIRFWLAYDPLTALRRVRQPVLVLHGAHDWQVPPADAATAAATLRAAGNREVTVHVLPELNHLLLHDPEPAASVEHYTKLPDKTVPPRVLGVLADWLAAKLGR